MLEIKLSPKQTVSQQTVMTATILQMNALELENYLQELTLENPVIELLDPAPNEGPGEIEIQRKMEWLEENDYQNRAYYHDEKESMGSREDVWDGNKSQQQSLAEYLRLQLMTERFSDMDHRILEYLIESLDPKGYFTDGIQSAARVLHVSEDRVKAMLLVIQRLEPAGVGAEDLRECLLLQLKNTEEDTTVAEKLVENHLEELAKNHLKTIARSLRVSMEELDSAISQIKRLNPKPGSSFASKTEALYIRPDAFVMPEDEECTTFRIIVRDGGRTSFKISEYYQSMEKETADREARQYLRDKLSQADFVARGIENRKVTLYRVVGAIVNRQTEFFSDPAAHKKPLKLSELAEDLDLHESTVSRALKGKYLQCRRGIFPLRYFLTSTVTENRDTNEALTPEQIKAAISGIIAAEDKKKPLSDGAIQELLARENMQIARRTVNKYRKELGIPDKSGRKEW